MKKKGVGPKKNRGNQKTINWPQAPLREVILNSLSVGPNEENDFTNQLDDSNFRLSAKRVFLTYTHCNESPETIRQHLESLGTEILQFVVSSERHEDGDKHLHACCEFKHKLNVRNARHFDFGDVHPHIGTIRNWDKAAEYCRKDGDYIEHITKKRKRDDESYVRALESGSYDDFMANVRNGAPRDFVLYWSAIDSFARRTYAIDRGYTSNYTFADFRETPEMQEWRMRYVYRPRPEGRPKTLCLIGPSRSGKTEWARSLGSHIYLNSYYDIREMLAGKDSDYIIFDDIPWERIPAPKALLGCQDSFILTDKYFRKTVFENWSKPAIILWNPDMDPSNDWTKDLIDWAEENIIFNKIYEKLY